MGRAVLVVSLFAVGLAPADESLTPACLIRMSRCQLLELYQGGAVTAAPAGFVRGYPIFEPGRRLTAARTHATRLLWQGKEFVDCGSVMINHVVGLKMVRANVFLAESWYDGRPTLAFDYQGASKLFGDVRDEVREVAPGVLLGLTYVRQPDGPELKVFFVLDARPR